MSMLQSIENFLKWETLQVFRNGGSNSEDKMNNTTIIRSNAYIFWRTKKRICVVTLFCNDSTIISIAIKVFIFSNPSCGFILFSRKWPWSSISISCTPVSHLELLSRVYSSKPSSSKDASINCQTFENTNSTEITAGSEAWIPKTSERCRASSTAFKILQPKMQLSITNYSTAAVTYLMKKIIKREFEKTNT